MKIAVVCANGIGDALILHTASLQLRAHGYEVVTFTNHHFPRCWEGFMFAPQPKLEQLRHFDRILLQYDNTPKAKAIRDTFPNVYSLFGSYVPAKHGPLKEGFDFVCDRSRPFLDNLLSALREWFSLSSLTKDNGLRAPKTALYRRFPRRVAIHTTSAEVAKNWPMGHFLCLSERLQAAGFEPVIFKPLPTLDDLAIFLYESGYFIGGDSGPGHLASCLGIPTLTIAGDREAIGLWRPGWGNGLVVVPPMSLKISRKYWKTLLRPKRAFVQFQNLVNSFQQGDCHERPSTSY